MSRAGNSADPIAVAAVGKTRGLIGEVFLYPYFDISGESLSGAHGIIRWRDGRERSVVINAIGGYAGKTTCRFEGIDDIDAARELATGELFIDRADLAPLDSDEFYINDLVGLAVKTVDGQPLGVVSAVQVAGSAPLMKVLDGTREYLIPFVRQIAVEVDMAARLVIVDPPSGLLEINDN